jgi:uncharacterized protein
MSVLPSDIYSHFLAAYLLIITPLFGYFRHRKAKERMQSGDRLAKALLLREVLIRQVINTCLVCGLWIFGGVPGALLGLRAPPSWLLTIGLTVATAIFLVVSALRLRAKSGQIREKLDQRAGALLPDSATERRWFAAICVCGGIYEELAYRGFLFYYLGLVIPQINGVEKGLVTSVLFGLGHLYQGRKGMIATGVAGLIMAAFYLVGGNLLLPVVAHIIGNLRALLIFPSRSTGENRA